MTISQQIDRSSIARPLSEELRSHLRSIPLLSTLTDEQLTCFANSEEIHAHDQEILVHQGEISNFFWILVHGELEMVQHTADGHEIVMYTMPAGTTFGEIALLASYPSAINVRSKGDATLIRLPEDSFWQLMTLCPTVRKNILGNMAMRLQKMQSVTVQQEKMATLGTLAAGLMHELNNPGAAARRAASQLRDNLLRMHHLSAKFTQTSLSHEQKQCICELQEQALSVKRPLVMNSLEQSDAEDALVQWMEEASIENAWKLAPALVAIGIDSTELECARSQFSGDTFSDALSWLEALVSSMQLVSTIEESIGRVSDLVKAVKSYAYEGQGQRHTLVINESIHATLVILGHKLREKQITLEKDFAADLPNLETCVSGLNQIWTNLLDNAIDAVPQGGNIRIRTWQELVAPNSKPDSKPGKRTLCISIADNGPGIPADSQERIFEPFFTTKPVGVGTGLGLGIVHRIVQQYGGSISFSSHPGQTEFLVRLPASD